MYILFGFTVIMAMITRLAERFLPKDGSRLLAGNTWWQKHVAVPALFGRRHAEPWVMFSLPTRLHSIMVGGCFGC